MINDEEPKPLTLAELRAAIADADILEQVQAAEIMARVFGAEWAALDEPQRALVAADYLAAVLEDQCDANEYRRRIGRGNLGAYVQCLEIGERRKSSAPATNESKL